MPGIEVRPVPSQTQKEHMQGVRGGEPLPAPAPKEPMQGVRGGEPLPAPAPKEPMQGVRGGEPLRPPLPAPLLLKKNNWTHERSHEVSELQRVWSPGVGVKGRLKSRAWRRCRGTAPGFGAARGGVGRGSELSCVSAAEAGPLWWTLCSRQISHAFCFDETAHCTRTLHRVCACTIFRSLFRKQGQGRGAPN